MDWKRRLSVMAYNGVARLLFRPDTPPEKMRARFETVSVVSRKRLHKKYPDIAFADHNFSGVYAESTQAHSKPDKVIVHLHGGAYVMGSSASFRVDARKFSDCCHARVYMVDYRKSPEHRFPAALDDARTAWRQICEQHPDLPVFLTGDSCGGGLALALAMQLRDEGAALPPALVLISPWTDLACSGDSYRDNARKDGWLSRAHTQAWAPYYLGGINATHPLASPLYGDFAALPPLLFIVGGNEVLLDDARRCVEKAHRTGTPVRLEVGEQMPHDYPLSLPWLKESRRAWRRLSRFLEEHRPSVPPPA